MGTSLQPHYSWRGALCAAVLLSVTAHGQAQPASPPATKGPATAAVAEAATVRTASRMEIRAQLTPRRFTTLASEVGARIQRMPFAEGMSFSEGQVLVALDCSVQQAQLDKSRAELEAAEHTFKSNQRLSDLNSIGQLELELSRVAVNRARAEVSGQQALLTKCSIAAPFSGRVAEQKAREQQFVQPGQALLDVLDDSVMELEFIVPSHWLTWLKPGLPLRVVIDETRRAYPARFTRIGARVDPVSQSVKVAAAIDGKHPELVAGMSGRIQVQSSPSAQ